MVFMRRHRREDQFETTRKKYRFQEICRVTERVSASRFKMVIDSTHRSAYPKWHDKSQAPFHISSPISPDFCRSGRISQHSFWLRQRTGDCCKRNAESRFRWSRGASKWQHLRLRQGGTNDLRAL